MEQAHKDLLRKHRVRLVQDLDVAYVFDGLVQKNIFDPADYEDFEVKLYSYLIIINRLFDYWLKTD